MKTLKMNRGRLTALAALGLVLTSVISTPVLAADVRPVMPLNGWNDKLGPGIGGVKTPFLIVEVGRPLGRASEDETYFHTSTGQPVQQVPITRLGPGVISVTCHLWATQS